MSSIREIYQQPTTQLLFPRISSIRFFFHRDQRCSFFVDPIMTKIKWASQRLPLLACDLPTVLRAGQAFRWRHIEGTWSCALGQTLVLLRQTEEDQLDHACLVSDNGIPKQIDELDSWKIVSKYFRLDHDISSLHSMWSKLDIQFPENTGVRILAQEPWETLVSFIISSNNNIKRISQLCEALCIKYGQIMFEYEGLPYYTFPKPYDMFKLQTKLEDGVSESQILKLESELRTLGFGYRAGYIANTAADMINKPHNWETLASVDKWKDDDECIQFLLQFKGVGPKVADCVALMGCSRLELVPIDTHVWRIVQNTYRKEFVQWTDSLEDRTLAAKLKKSLGNKAVDVKLYSDFRQFFKCLWGFNAGWAQAVVFAGEVALQNGINHPDDFFKLHDKIHGFSEELKSNKRVKLK